MRTYPIKHGNSLRDDSLEHLFPIIYIYIYIIYIYICSDNRFGSCPDAILENENSDWEAFWPTNPLNQKGR